MGTPLGEGGRPDNYGGLGTSTLTSGACDRGGLGTQAGVTEKTGSRPHNAIQATFL